jgi:hypothetical protein
MEVKKLLQCSIPGGGLGIFLFTTASRTALGPTQPPIQWVPGILSLGVKRPGREAGYSLPSSAEVKNAWSYTSSLQYVFMAWCLVKQRNNFTLSLTRNTGFGGTVLKIATRESVFDRESNWIPPPPRVHTKRVARCLVKLSHPQTDPYLEQ